MPPANPPEGGVALARNEPVFENRALTDLQQTIVSYPPCLHSTLHRLRTKTLLKTFYLQNHLEMKIASRERELKDMKAELMGHQRLAKKMRDEWVEEKLKAGRVAMAPYG